MNLAQRESPDPSNKLFAQRLLAMIDTSYVNYREYIPWADAEILRLDSPPYWILNLCITHYRPKALEIITEFLNADPCVPFVSGIVEDESIACLYLRFARRELSWATFLRLAGERADSYQQGMRECEYFYAYLNKLEASDFSIAIEEQQMREVNRQYAELAESLQRTYAEIKGRCTQMR